MITGLYAALLTVLLVILLFGVIAKRLKYKVGLGTGGIKDLEQAIRAHGNFVEVVPFALILMILMEKAGVQPWVLHLYGVTLLIARILHALGLYQSPYRSKGRVIGIMLCNILLLLGAFVLIIYYLKGVA